MGRYFVKRCLIGALIACCGFGAAQAQTAPAPLPDPLTLEAALELADDAHPALLAARAELALAEAGRGRADAEGAMELGMEAWLTHLDPSDTALDESRNDSLATLTLSKRLYDFGRTEASQGAAGAAYRGKAWGLLGARQERRILIMQRFFDVLLADLRYARDNEAMSIAYVDYDKAQDRHELGQLSDIALADSERIYQDSRRQLVEARSMQRRTRARLALALNRPDELSANLLTPPLEALDRPLPMLDAVTQQALERNPGLQALRAELETARQAVARAENDFGPVIRAEVTAAEYARQTGSRHPLTASLVLELPLYTGGRSDAGVAAERARMHQAQARLATEEFAVREAAIDLVMELEVLEARRQELDVLGFYRELYLDRSRALYDLEVSTDLGDSMTLTSDHRWLEARARFDTALAWARLDALTGSLLTPDPSAEDIE